MQNINFDISDEKRVNAKHICKRCVMDDSALDFFLTASGCNYCDSYYQYQKNLPVNQGDASLLLDKKISEIRNKSQNLKYNCVIGLSGGVDSTYLAWLVKKQFGLRPLAVHVDNGWNDELAVHNIEKIVKTLSLDLITEVLDWKTFSSIQRAFLKASVPDCEIPTDHAIYSSLYKIARKMNIPTIIVGSNPSTEYIMPLVWSQGHRDWKYISSIAQNFENINTSKIPHTGFLKRLYNVKFSNISREQLFHYLQFDKKVAEECIKHEFNWEPYQYKHYESVYTKFFQGYWLPKKFGFDKRKAHLSNLICANQITRKEAIDILSEPAISPQDEIELINYICEKLDLNRKEFDELLENPNKSFYHYPSTYNCQTYFFIRHVYRYTVKPVLNFFGQKIDTI